MCLGTPLCQQGEPTIHITDAGGGLSSIGRLVHFFIFDMLSVYQKVFGGEGSYARLQSEGQISGHPVDLAHVHNGSRVPVRNMRMQPSTRDFATVVSCHSRTPACRRSRFPWRCRRTSSSEVDQPFAKKIAKGGFPPPPSFGSQIRTAGATLIPPFGPRPRRSAEAGGRRSRPAAFGPPTSRCRAAAARRAAHRGHSKFWIQVGSNPQALRPRRYLDTSRIHPC